MAMAAGSGEYTSQPEPSFQDNRPSKRPKNDSYNSQDNQAYDDFINGDMSNNTAAMKPGTGVLPRFKKKRTIEHQRNMSTLLRQLGIETRRTNDEYQTILRENNLYERKDGAEEYRDPVPSREYYDAAGNKYEHKWTHKWTAYKTDDVEETTPVITIYLDKTNGNQAALLNTFSDNIHLTGTLLRKVAFANFAKRIILYMDNEPNPMVLSFGARISFNHDPKYGDTYDAEGVAYTKYLAKHGLISTTVRDENTGATVKTVKVQGEKLNISVTFTLNTETREITEAVVDTSAEENSNNNQLVKYLKAWYKPRVAITTFTTKQTQKTNPKSVLTWLRLTPDPGSMKVYANADLPNYLAKNNWASHTDPFVQRKGDKASVSIFIISAQTKSKKVHATFTIKPDTNEIKTDIKLGKGVKPPTDQSFEEMIKKWYQPRVKRRIIKAKKDTSDDDDLSDTETSQELNLEQTDPWTVRIDPSREKKTLQEYLKDEFKIYNIKNMNKNAFPNTIGEPKAMTAIRNRYKKYYESYPGRYQNLEAILQRYKLNPKAGFIITFNSDEDINQDLIILICRKMDDNADKVALLLEWPSTNILSRKKKKQIFDSICTKYDVKDDEYHRLVRRLKYIEDESLNKIKNAPTDTELTKQWENGFDHRRELPNDARYNVTTFVKDITFSTYTESFPLFLTAIEERLGNQDCIRLVKSLYAMDLKMTSIRCVILTLTHSDREYDMIIIVKDLPIDPSNPEFPKIYHPGSIMSDEQKKAIVDEIYTQIISRDNQMAGPTNKGPA